MKNTLEKCDNQKDLVSVLVPAYNASSTIKKCVESIIDQSYQNIEIIIVDDGSTDDTGIICDDFASKDRRIRVIHKKNGGLVNARKTGIKSARGKFIGFVDADDYVEPQFYKRLYEIISSEDVDFVHAGYYKNGVYYGSEESFVVRINDTNRLSVLCDFLDSGVNDNHISPSIWSKLFKSEACKRLYLELNDDACFGEDLIFLCNCLMGVNSFYVLNEAYYHYEYSNESMSHKKDAKQLANEIKLYNDVSCITQVFKGNEKYDRAMRNFLLYHTLIGLESISYRSDLTLNYYYPQIERLFNKKIILYGAGRVGVDYYKQIRLYRQCNLVLWVDINYKDIKKDYSSVESPQCIITTEYDLVVLAIKSDKQRKEAKEELLRIGVEEMKISSDRPLISYID